MKVMKCLVEMNLCKHRKHYAEKFVVLKFLVKEFNELFKKYNQMDK